MAEKAEAVAAGAGGAEQPKGGVAGATATVATATVPGAKRIVLPKAKVLLLGVIVAGVVAGAALGAFLIGPKVVGARSSGSAAPATTKGAAAHGAAAASHAKLEKHEPGFVLEYDNIIVNPAGAEGSHFLMVTVGLELSDQKSSQLLEEREIQVRDEIITILASQTMEALMRPGARDEVKKQLAEVLIPMAGHPKWMEIYLPQFVIQ